MGEKICRLLWRHKPQTRPGVEGLVLRRHKPQIRPGVEGRLLWRHKPQTMSGVEGRPCDVTSLRPGLEKKHPIVTSLASDQAWSRRPPIVTSQKASDQAWSRRPPIVTSQALQLLYNCTHCVVIAGSCTHRADLWSSCHSHRAGLWSSCHTHRAGIWSSCHNHRAGLWSSWNTHRAGLFMELMPHSPSRFMELMPHSPSWFMEFMPHSPSRFMALMPHSPSRFMELMPHSGSASIAVTLCAGRQLWANKHNHNTIHYVYCSQRWQKLLWKVTIWLLFTGKKNVMNLNCQFHGKMVLIITILITTYTYICQTC